MSSKTPIARLVKAHLLSSGVSPTIEHEDILETSLFASFVRAAPHRSGQDCLLLSELDWMQEAQSQPYDSCTDFLNLVGQLIAPKKCFTALELLTSSRFISSGLPSLDSALQGGFRIGHLIEFVSRSGSGKSIFCLTSCAHLLLRNPNCSVLYVDSDRKFNLERWLEIVFQLGGNREEMASRLVVLRPEELRHVLPMLRSATEEVSQPVGLIVIDSVTSLFPVQASMHDFLGLAHFAAELKLDAELLGIPVLISNQQQRDEGRLGNSWHHLVNVRLFLDIDPDVGHRTIRVGKSPDANTGDTPLSFSISASGIVPCSSPNEDVRREWHALFETMTQEELNLLL